MLEFVVYISCSSVKRNMVAVKMLWVLWKSFSSFSFSGGPNNNNNKEDKKRVRYNRLRPQNKSHSHPINLTATDNKPTMSITDVNGNLNCSKKCLTKSESDEIGWRYDFDNSDSDEHDDDHITTSGEESEGDFDDEDEGLTCDVCDRAFSTARKLSDHQQKKRHFGCLQCDSIFPSRQALEHHREQMDHYDFVSDYDGSDTTSFDSEDDHVEEEKERLL